MGGDSFGVEVNPLGGAAHAFPVPTACCARGDRRGDGGAAGAAPVPWSTEVCEETAPHRRPGAATLISLAHAAPPPWRSWRWRCGLERCGHAWAIHPKGNHTHAHHARWTVVIRMTLSNAERRFWHCGDHTAEQESA